MQVSEKTMQFPFTKDGIINGCNSLVNEITQHVGDCAIRVIFREQTDTEGECSVKFTRNQSLEKFIPGAGTKIIFSGLSPEQCQLFQDAINKAGFSSYDVESYPAIIQTEHGGGIVHGPVNTFQNITGLTPEMMKKLFPGNERIMS